MSKGCPYLARQRRKKHVPDETEIADEKHPSDWLWIDRMGDLWVFRFSPDNLSMGGLSRADTFRSLDVAWSKVDPALESMKSARGKTSIANANTKGQTFVGWVISPIFPTTRPAKMMGEITHPTSQEPDGLV